MLTKSIKPYCVIGAENLSASVYKTGDELIGFDYRFNITRLNIKTGRVNQWFVPSDIEAFTKLISVLAAELAEDGCMDVHLRRRIRLISAALNETLDRIDAQHPINGDHRS